MCFNITAYHVWSVKYIDIDNKVCNTVSTIGPYCFSLNGKQAPCGKNRYQTRLISVVSKTVKSKWDQQETHTSCVSCQLLLLCLELATMAQDLGPFGNGLYPMAP